MVLACRVTAIALVIANWCGNLCHEVLGRRILLASSTCFHVPPNFFNLKGDFSTHIFKISLFSSFYYS